MSSSRKKKGSAVITLEFAEKARLAQQRAGNAPFLLQIAMEADGLHPNQLQQDPGTVLGDRCDVLGEQIRMYRPDRPGVADPRAQRFADPTEFYAFSVLHEIDNGPVVAIDRGRGR